MGGFVNEQKQPKNEDAISKEVAAGIEQHTATLPIDLSREPEEQTVGVPSGETPASEGATPGGPAPGGPAPSEPASEGATPDGPTPGGPALSEPVNGGATPSGPAPGESAEDACDSDSLVIASDYEEEGTTSAQAKDEAESAPEIETEQ